MRWLFCYDICDQRRLHRVARVLEDYGIRVQYSFFEVECEEETRDIVIGRIREVMDEKVDLLYVYPVCAACAGRVQKDGSGNWSLPEHFVIL